MVAGVCGHSNQEEESGQEVGLGCKTLSSTLNDPLLPAMNQLVKIIQTFKTASAAKDQMLK